MNSLIRRILVGTLLGAALLSIETPAARSDDYWKHYWRWYDRTYRPYFHRRYFYAPPPVNYPPAPPGPTYYGNGITTYYGPAYPYYGSGIVVGPTRYGWW